MGEGVMSRKNLFGNLAVPIPQAGGEPPAAMAPERPFVGKERKPPRMASALGAITESLGAITEKAQKAEEMERRLAEGLTIVELDPASIDVSFVRDRMIYTDEDHTKLVEAIRANGQQVPILVRPHPKEPGRYQVAYGHRRLRAVTELGIQVRAVIRNLTDEQLVVAQGQENNERTNLTFIEKARFALRLEDAGFSREVIQQALCVDKTYLSRLINSIKNIPPDIIDAIGYAPSIGQRRWQEFSEKLTAQKLAGLREALHSPEAQTAISDKRFEIALKALLTERPFSPPIEQWVSADGIRLAKYSQADKKFSLVIDEKAVPQFGQFLIGRMQSIYEEFVGSQSR
jgi:ParB family chromosome partitioning protein